MLPFHTDRREPRVTLMCALGVAYLNDVYYGVVLHD